MVPKYNSDGKSLEFDILGREFEPMIFYFFMLNVCSSLDSRKERHNYIYIRITKIIFIL